MVSLVCIDEIEERGQSSGLVFGTHFVNDESRAMSKFAIL